MKVSSVVTDDGDVKHFQCDLTKLYSWGKMNNCVFNNDKFMVMRNGRNEEIKMDTVYFTLHFESIIKDIETCRDLGLMLDNNGAFEFHINKVCAKVRKLTGWICRSFMNRFVSFFLKKYGSCWLGLTFTTSVRYGSLLS